MNGGAILFNTRADPTVVDMRSALLHFLRNHTACTYMNTHSLYGSLFRIQSTSQALIRADVLDTNIGYVNQIMVKVGYIGTPAQVAAHAMVTFNVRVGQISRMYVSSTSFTDEMRIQQLVYRNTLTSAFDAICPCPILGLIHNVGHQNEIINELRRMQDFRPVLGHNIGIIFMEAAIGTTVGDAFTQNGLIWDQANRQLNKTYIDVDALPCIAMLNYAFALIRLQSIGFHHGDSHLGNAMFCPCNTPSITNKQGGGYYLGYKVLLLDFGKTTQIPAADLNNQTFRWYTQDPNLWWSFRAIEGIYNHLIAGSLHMRNVEGVDITVDMQSFINQMKRHMYDAQISWFASIIPQSMTIVRKTIRNNAAVYTGLERLNFLANYPNGNVEVSKQWLFLKGRVPSRANTVNATQINLVINPSSNCCQNSQDNLYYNYLENGNTYNWTYATAVGPRVVEAYLNEQLMSAQDGYYLWIIGHNFAGVTIFASIRITTPGEIATKHSHLMIYANIQNYYLAGELEKRGNNISYNLSSGTYMFIPIRIDNTNAAGVLDANAMNETLQRYGMIAKIYINLALYDRVHPVRLTYLRTTLTPGNTYLQPTFIVGTNQEICNLAHSSSARSGINTYGYQTVGQCTARQQPNRLLPPYVPAPPAPVPVPPAPAPPAPQQFAPPAPRAPSPMLLDQQTPRPFAPPAPSQMSLDQQAPFRDIRLPQARQDPPAFQGIQQQPFRRVQREPFRRVQRDQAEQDQQAQRALPAGPPERLRPLVIKKRPLPLTGGSQLDDIKQTENSIFVTFSDNYEELNGVSNEVISYVKKNELGEIADTLLKLVYIVKDNLDRPVEIQQQVTRRPSVASELQSKKMIHTDTRKEMMAGKKTRRFRKRKTKRRR